MAIAHKGKKKKNQSNGSLDANKTHIDSYCKCLLFKMLKLGSTTGNGSKYYFQHFQGDKFTVKKCLWARFIMKEQKLMTTSNKEMSFYGQRFTHREARTIQVNGSSVSGRGFQNNRLLFCW
jgi:hypothetical protein